MKTLQFVLLQCYLFTTCICKNSSTSQSHQNIETKVPAEAQYNLSSIEEGVNQPKDILPLKEEVPIPTKNRNRRNDTDTKDYPFMAGIIINGRLWCTGVVVDQLWVVTAAHCLNYVLNVFPPKSLDHYLKVRVGSPNPHKGGQLVGVGEVIRHPKFAEGPVLHFDVALLKLTKNLEYKNYVNHINIYEDKGEPSEQSFVTVTGWGATRETNLAVRDHSPNLLTSSLKVRGKRYCEDMYQLVTSFKITDEFFCASLKNGTRDVCLFDSGAPAVQKNRLVGIMSFGPTRCGHEFQPAVFIKAFYFKDFVKETISSGKTSDHVEDATPDAHDPTNITKDTAEATVTIIVDPANVAPDKMPKM